MTNEQRIFLSNKRSEYYGSKTEKENAYNYVHMKFCLIYALAKQKFERIT